MMTEHDQPLKISAPSKKPCTGVILSGGLNIRFDRKNKALATIGSEKIIEHTIGVFRRFFNEILIVTNTPSVYAPWDVTIVTDIYPVRSPLTGIFTGLFYAASPHIFVAACDTPFLQTGLVETIVDSIDSNADIFIPATKKGLEPLCAAYSKKCLSPIEFLLLNHMGNSTQTDTHKKRILKKSLKIQNFFNKVRVKTIKEDHLREKDPTLVSLFNVNTPEDLETAMAMSRATPKESS